MGNASGAMRMLLAVTVNAIGIKQREFHRSIFLNPGQVIVLWLYATSNGKPSEPGRKEKVMQFNRLD